MNNSLNVNTNGYEPAHKVKLVMNYGQHVVCDVHGRVRCLAQTKFNRYYCYHNRIPILLYGIRKLFIHSAQLHTISSFGCLQLYREAYNLLEVELWTTFIFFISWLWSPLFHWSLNVRMIQGSQPHCFSAHAKQRGQAMWCLHRVRVHILCLPECHLLSSGAFGC